jgi:hypothetical protein
MGRRKGELTAAAIDRGWPASGRCPGRLMQRLAGRFMDAFCLDLSVCERASRTRSTPRNFASLDAALLETEAAPVQSRYLAGRVSGMAAHKNAAAIKAAVARLRNPAQWPNV